MGYNTNYDIRPADMSETGVIYMVAVLTRP